MAKNWLVAIVGAVVGTLAWHLFKETIWAIAVEKFIEEAAHFLDLERPVMVAHIVQFLFFVVPSWVVIYALVKWAHAKGVAEANQIHKAKVEVPAPIVGPEIQRLVGVVNALKERVLDYNFRLPLKPEDPFVGYLDEIRNSAHPIWADDNIGQLRREFLHSIDIVATRHEYGSAAEFKETRAELSKFSRQLIDALNGKPSKSG